MRYLFPPNNRACKCSYLEQAAKILEESNEVSLEAITFTSKLGTDEEVDNSRFLLMETLDVIHACESMLRKFDQREVNAAFLAVLEKNEARGDYDEDVDE